jgi:hypothetical protein
MKLFFGLTVVAVALYLCVEFIPPYYSNYEFQDDIKNEALLATNDSRSESAIQDTIFKRAQHYSIPITKEGIKVHRVGTNGSGSVTIEAPYVVHVDLIAFPVDLTFNASTTNVGAFN